MAKENETSKNHTQVVGYLMEKAKVLLYVTGGGVDALTLSRIISARRGAAAWSSLVYPENKPDKSPTDQNNLR